MIKISDLFVGQNYLRRTDYIEDMIKFIRSGGFWTTEAMETWVKEHPGNNVKPISISQFEDGVLFVHDGHHRLVSTYIGGRETLREDEYVQKSWKYEDYLKVDFIIGFVTPFDVKTECRTCDFFTWKQKVLDMAKVSEPLAMDTIKAESHVYCEPRINNLIMQLAAEYQKLHKPKPKKGIIKASGVKRTALGFELGQEAANAENLRKIQEKLGPDRPIDLAEVERLKNRFSGEMLHERTHQNPYLEQIVDENNKRHQEARKAESETIVDPPKVDEPSPKTEEPKND